MPFDTAQGVVCGDDARKVPQWARATFCAWLAAKLNDPAGPYAEALGITEERQAVVSDNSLLLREKYSSSTSPPVVGVMQGPVASRLKTKKIGEVVYEGSRHEIELNIDMGVSDRLPDDDDETKTVNDDSLLGSFVADAVERGLEELGDLGLYNADIDPDVQKQRAGEGRFPHKLTFFCLSLDDWTPE